jgi:hypothetical protein
MAGDGSVEASQLQREVLISASVVSLELMRVHHKKIENFKVNFNFKKFKINV